MLNIKLTKGIVYNYIIYNIIYIVVYNVLETLHTFSGEIIHTIFVVELVSNCTATVPLLYRYCHIMLNSTPNTHNFYVCLSGTHTVCRVLGLKSSVPFSTKNCGYYLAKCVESVSRVCRVSV